MAANTKAHPIKTLRQYVTDIEAGILVCLDDPAMKPVHRLRTTTRRIEAQLILLKLLRVPLIHGGDAQKAGRLLKKIRRAAGEVRDLDVQIDLIAEHAPTNARRDADRLIASLKQQRDDASATLIKVLGKQHPKLTQALESLMRTVEETQPADVTSTQLSSLTREWFAKTTPEQSDDPDRLHRIRKNAKLARYLAENGPKSARTVRNLAAKFESVQEAGGQWHDWLILAEIASDQVGKSSELTRFLVRRCRTSLSAYRRRLTDAKKWAHPQA
jgi:CHAD domain-containing protein